MELEIKGLQKTSLIDYAPYTSCVVFLGGCSFRCPFCQNPDLVLSPEKLETIKQDDLFEFLRKRKKWLDGVCITGGEPTIHEELPEFIKKIKELGYTVKLDTNGHDPAILKELIDKKLIDYAAMDIKNSLQKYNESSGVKVDIEKIKESADIIRNSGIDYEFRMTLVPKLHEKDDLEKIGRWLKGAKRFFLQQFSNKICLDRRFEKIAPFSKDELEDFQAILRKHIPNAEIRENI